MHISQYKPMDTAPKGDPIIAVVDGCECAIIWADPFPGILAEGWYYFEEDGDGPLYKVKGEVRGWKETLYSRMSPDD